MQKLLQHRDVAMTQKRSPALAATSEPGGCETSHRKCNTGTLQLHVVEVDDGDIQLDSQPPLIPDGEYQMRCTGYEKATVFRTAKVFLNFQIVEFGEHCGKRLYRAFRASGFTRHGKGPGTGSRIKLKARSELFTTLCRLLDLPARTRPDRVSLRELKGKIFNVRTRTVKRDYRQRPIPEFLWYSVVDEVISVEVG